MRGGRPIYVKTSHTNRFVPTRRDLERAITNRTKAIGVVSPSNPTGVAYTAQELSHVVDVAEKHGLWILFDEAYCELVYGRTHHTITGSTGNIVSFRTLSKSHNLTGMRIGWVLSSNKVIIERIRKHVAFNVMCVNTLAQRVAEIAVTGDNSELAARKEFYFENMRRAYERMTELGWNVHYPEGSFYLFPKHGVAEPISAQILWDTKVAVIDGQHFGPSGAGHVRISCCVPRPVLTEGIERIVNWFKRRRFAVPPPARPLPQRARSITGEPSGPREIAGVLG